MTKYREKRRKCNFILYNGFLFVYATFGLFNPLSANSTKWSNTLKQFVGNLPTNCLSVFDHFERLVFKELSYQLHGSTT